MSDRFNLQQGRSRWLIFDKTSDSFNDDSPAVNVRDYEMAQRITDFLNRDDRERNAR